MNAEVPKGNAAFYYHPDGFETARPNLMGRHAAGEGFLQGFFRHSGLESVYCYAEKKSQFEQFAETAKKYSKSKRSCHWIPWTRWGKLSEVGCLFLPGPDISELAWQRRHGDQRAFSLFGVTHTTASARIMDGIGQLLTAPVQPWDAVVCTSVSVKSMVQRVLNNYASYVKDRFGLPAIPTSPVHLPVIPLGVDCASFAVSDEHRSQLRTKWREKLQIPQDEFVALYVGRISFHAKAHPMPMYKGLELAAQRSKKKLHLVMSGWFANQAIEKEFVEGAKAFCPSVTVHFVDGRHSEVRKSIWYAADIFTSLSDNIQETFGLTPIEAMAAGLPVVVSDWDGYKETVREGIDGFRIRTWIPPVGLAEDLALSHAIGITNYDRYVGYQSQFTAVEVEDCARAYQRLVEDPALCKTMGESGRARARALFDWSVIVRSYQTVWSELAELRGKAKETCQRPQSAAANPLRDDPTRMFGHYATNVLKPATLVTLNTEVGFEEIDLLHSFSMNSVGSELRYSPKDFPELLELMSVEESVTVQSIFSKIPAAKGRSLLYTILWMSKMGVITLTPSPAKMPSTETPLAKT